MTLAEKKDQIHRYMDAMGLKKLDGGNAITSWGMLHRHISRIYKAHEELIRGKMTYGFVEYNRENDQISIRILNEPFNTQIVSEEINDASADQILDCLNYGARQWAQQQYKLKEQQRMRDAINTILDENGMHEAQI